MIYLAIDLGDVRTGLAVGDDELKIASPVGTVTTKSPQERMRQVAQAVREHEPNELVIGLPLNMDGSEGPAAKKVRAFGEELARATGLSVRYTDERLTSAAADDRMAQTGLTHKQKKNRRDALAACAILQDFFQQIKGSG